jgi:hypothetical protein
LRLKRASALVYHSRAKRATRAIQTKWRTKQMITTSNQASKSALEILPRSMFVVALLLALQWPSTVFAQ